MRSKYSLPLVTGVGIALLAVGLVANTRVDVAYAVSECVYQFQHPLPEKTTDLRKLQECERDARHSGIGLGYVLAIFALAGATAAVLGYVAGARETVREHNDKPKALASSSF
jgi:hypothetical protein